MDEDLTYVDANEGKMGRKHGKLHQLRSLLRIDREMLPMKVTYLLWGGIIGSYKLYLNPFFVSVGVSKSQAGVLAGIPYIVYTVVAPLWGILTDYSGRRRLIAVSLCFCSAGFISSLPWIAKIAANRSGNNSLTNNSTSNSNDTLLTNMSLSSDSSDSLSGSADALFSTLFCVMSLGSVFSACDAGYIEAIALKTIKACPTGASYGGQRFFGSTGTMIVLYLTGVVLDHVAIEGYSPFAILFFIYPIFSISLIPMLLVIIGKQEKWTRLKIENADIKNHDDTSREREHERSISAHLLAMFATPDVIVLMLTALVAGVAFCLIFFYVFLINEQMDVSKSGISLVFSVQSFANIIMFPFTSKLIRVLRGPIPSIVLGLLCFCIRYVVMAYTTIYWVMVVVQLLQAFSFALLWSSLMEQVHTLSPSKIRLTMTTIIQSVFFGLGASLCNMVGGMIYEMSNARTLFLWVGVACGVWAFILVVYYGIKHCVCEKNQEPAFTQGSCPTDHDLLFETSS